MSNSSVREAFEQSVTERPVSLNASQASIVPMRACPAAAFSARPSTFCSNHSIFVPEK
jgi:hypothetical protein